MNILRLILENLKRGTLTARFPRKQPLSAHYRGLIENDPERCVGCGQCAYVCPSCAMEVHRDGDKYQWKYDAGKCTFCGRCIDRCKLHTLTMRSERPPVYGVQGELKQELNMVRKRPVRPAAVAASGKDAAKLAPAIPTAQTGTVDATRTTVLAEPVTESNAEAGPSSRIGSEAEQPV